MKVKDLVAQLLDQDQDMEVMARKINKNGYSKEFKTVTSLRRHQEGCFIFVGLDAQYIEEPKPRFVIKDEGIKTLTVMS